MSPCGLFCLSSFSLSSQFSFSYLLSDASVFSMCVRVIKITLLRNQNAQNVCTSLTHRYYQTCVCVCAKLHFLFCYFSRCLFFSPSRSLPPFLTPHIMKNVCCVCVCAWMGHRFNRSQSILVYTAVVPMCVFSVKPLNTLQLNSETGSRCACEKNIFVGTQSRSAYRTYTQTHTLNYMSQWLALLLNKTVTVQLCARDTVRRHRAMQIYKNFAKNIQQRLGNIRKSCTKYAGQVHRISLCLPKPIDICVSNVCAHIGSMELCFLLLLLFLSLLLRNYERHRTR